MNGSVYVFVWSDRLPIFRNYRGWRSMLNYPKGMLSQNPDNRKLYRGHTPTSLDWRELERAPKD